jgi:hypothetical protein
VVYLVILGLFVLFCAGLLHPYGRRLIAMMVAVLAVGFFGLRFCQDRAVKTAEAEKARTAQFQATSQKTCTSADLAGTGNPYDTDKDGFPCDLVAIYAKRAYKSN